LVQKVFGNTVYNLPINWQLIPGNFITETSNPCITTECGCGINFGTHEYIKLNHSEASEIWECLLLFEDMPSLVVPINTDGKCRCNRLQLIKKITVSPVK
jgi:hypothetical protein